MDRINLEYILNDILPIRIIKTLTHKKMGFPKMI